MDKRFSAPAMVAGGVGRLGADQVPPHFFLDLDGLIGDGLAPSKEAGHGLEGASGGFEYLLAHDYDAVQVSEWEPLQVSNRKCAVRFIEVLNQISRSYFRGNSGFRGSMV
jgi:hypothetical protein